MNSPPEVFAYRRGELFAEDVSLAAIAARVGTPCYVYSRSMIEARWRDFDEAFGGWPHLVCYAVKACPNLGVLSVLARLGSGFDIVSVGELERVLRAGGNPSKMIFSGVGKSQAEMRRALEVGVHCFNVESAAELELLNETARASKARAQIALRVNPDVDPNTHPYIATGLKENKFGVPIAAAAGLYARAQSLPHLRVAGVACHIGSQLVALSPFVDALERVLVLIDRLRTQGVPIADLDLGGGLGIRYRDDTPPDPRTYVDTLLKRLRAHRVQGNEMRILIEPGRALVGEAGVLLTRVEYLKPGEATSFAVVDAAVNDLL
ncbi:MAG TPA: diaminopimelate decarboxylase, partial [Gammaproteobacteria bacterium]|nr:diaminopimelate decarboxylase [Gammaproteobacteria bacterium]